MIKLVTVKEMSAIEKDANDGGLTYEKMMENAGKGLAKIVEAIYGPLKDRGVLGLVGSGNNGGDTLVALAYLANKGWKTSAYIVRERPAEDPLVSRLKDNGGELFSVETDKKFKELTSLVAANNVLLDGVLGTGISLPLRGKVAEVLEVVRQAVAGMPSPPYVVAVDCPSGIDLISGQAAPECIPANLTVTMAAIKSGLFKFPASNLIGELKIVGIGLTDEKSWIEIKRFVADATIVKASLPQRPIDAHKGTFGTALVVAGSVNYTGAVLLAGKAAYRVGAGLVTIGIPAPLHAALAGQFPEATWLLLPHELGVIAESALEVIEKNLDRPTALLLGPGFGLEETTKNFLSGLIGATSSTHGGQIGFVPTRKADKVPEKNLPPLVIDADGLKLLARIPGWHTQLPSPAVLTPHPGEMAVLAGHTIEEIQSDRLEVTEKFAKKWGHVVVLKGAYTIIASPEGNTAIIPVASPSLARAGTGDVLAGLIVGLLAQGVDPFQAAVSGCWIHAMAGLRAEKTMGNPASVMAGDILEAVPAILTSLEIKNEAQ